MMEVDRSASTELLAWLTSHCSHVLAYAYTDTLRRAKGDFEELCERAGLGGFAIAEERENARFLELPEKPACSD
jgi:hypothetical protein